MGRRRLYYYTECKYAIDVIENNEIKVCTFFEANDVNEHCNIYSSSDPDFNHTLEEHKQSVNRRHGVICFSEDWSSSIMWGHYANNHKGICLGFDLEYKEDPIYPVIYLNEKINIDDHYDVKLINGKPAWSREKGDAMQLIENNLRMKSSMWQYEKEHRIFVKLEECKLKSVHSNNLFFYDLHDDNLDISVKEVIFGIRNEIDINDFFTKHNDIITKNNILLSQVDKSKYTFNFTKKFWNKK